MSQVHDLVTTLAAIPELLQLQRRLAELASPPTASETVVITGRRFGTREFLANQDYEPSRVSWRLG
jgi:hypothetical protein